MTSLVALAVGVMAVAVLTFTGLLAPLLTAIMEGLSMVGGVLNYAVGIFWSQPAALYFAGSAVTTSLKIVIAVVGFMEAAAVGADVGGPVMLFATTAIPLPVFTSVDGMMITLIANVGFGTIIWSGNWAVAQYW